MSKVPTGVAIPARPRAFISYSWTTPQHEIWVLDLATELRESGVDVILDKWDLKEGHDKFHFMEQMVTDPTVSKVIVVSDREYAAKAAARQGGVGTETQIISAEIYNRVQQEKFVAVVTELDEKGDPALPTYLATRKYINMSTPQLRLAKMDQLLRWLYDKPLYEKPELGQPPLFLAADATANRLGTGSLHRRACKAVMDGAANAASAVGDYLTFLADKLSTLVTIPMDPRTPLDEEVLRRIADFQPYRDELVELFSAVAKRGDDLKLYEHIFAFLERLLTYTHPSRSVARWNEGQFDAAKFIAHEVFLYNFAVLLKNRLLGRARWFLEQLYFVAERDDLSPFTRFRRYLRSLEKRDRRLGLKRLSPTADLYESRSKRGDITFQDLMQADFMLFLWSMLHLPRYEHWFPDTLLYAYTQSRPFELFARAASGSFFAQVGALLNVPDKDALLAKYEEGVKRHEWKWNVWNGHGFDSLALMNAKALSSLP